MIEIYIFCLEEHVINVTEYRFCDLEAVFCYIAPKVIDSRDEPPEHKPSRKRYSESAAIQKSCKPMSWDIYELQNKLAQS